MCQDQSQTCGMSPSNRKSSLTPPTEAADGPAARTSGDDLGTVADWGVLSADLQGNITACDHATTNLFGYAAQEILKETLAGVFSAAEPAERRRLQKEILAAVFKDNRHECRLHGQTKSGKELIVQLRVTLLRDASTAPASLVAVARVVEGVSPAATEKPRPRELAEPAPISSRSVDGTQFILASPVMHKFMGLVDRVAGHSETVLITGETGTGKELIARTIHQSSQRRSRPWVDINCAALPENLVESELFGYEKGAFSGADASKPGLFELADRGTIFLDEIGELQLQTQVKLLRVLDGQAFYRLGGHRKIKVDVRIVAATNQDLEAAVKQGRFREDLFHRLGQFQLRVPPLRERPEDIVALAEHFLGLKSPGKAFTPDAISTLLSHSWPGNIRELRNLIAKVAMESSAAEIDTTKITAAISGGPTTLRQSASMPVGNLDSMEEQMIIRALERTGGHRSLAAEQLGISRRTLSRKLKEYNINANLSETPNALGFISLEQQKFFRARVQMPVVLTNSQGNQVSVQGVNLSTGGMGLDGLKEPLRFAGLLDVSFKLPDSDTEFRAKARIVWIGDEGRVGLRFAVIEPTLFEQLQHWTNKRMQDEGWEFPT